MKISGLTMLLAGVFVAGVLATATLAYIYVRSMRSVGMLQSQMTAINRDRSVMQAIATDAVEYSRHNPAIEPILHAVGIRVKAPAANPGR